MCTSEILPAVKWFSATDASSSVPPVTCVRIDKTVAGASWREWASWFKLARFLDHFP